MVVKRQARGHVSDPRVPVLTSSPEGFPSLAYLESEAITDLSQRVGDLTELLEIVDARNSIRHAGAFGSLRL